MGALTPIALGRISQLHWDSPWIPRGLGPERSNAMNEPALTQQRTPTHTRQGMGCWGG